MVEKVCNDPAHVTRTEVRSLLDEWGAEFTLTVKKQLADFSATLESSVKGSVGSLFAKFDKQISKRFENVEGSVLSLQAQLKEQSKAIEALQLESGRVSKSLGKA